MKTKFSKILGVGLTIAVLVSVLVVSAPASAASGSWSADDPANKPGTVAGVVVNDMTVAGNGTTAYAAASDNKIYKSTNGGSSWSSKNIGFTGFGTATKVAVAPDVADGSFVVAMTGTAVYVSTDGGVSFSAMAGVPVGTTLASVAVSPALGTSRTIAVAGTNNVTAASVLYFSSGSAFGGGTGGWIDALNSDWATGNVTAKQSALAVKFSPSFLSDRTLVVITADAAQVAYLNLANIATKKWNGDYAVYGMTGASAGGSAFTGSNVTSAAIDMPSSYNAFDSTTRIAYVALAGTTGGLYRNSSTKLDPTSMNSVAVNGAGDKLVSGGASSGNTVYRLASPSTATSTTGLSTSSLSKSPGYAGNTMVTVDFFGASVGAATQGTESAFALSGDDGKSFNDVAFVNVGAGAAVPQGLTVKSDGSKTYLVTYNSASGVTSIWRKTASWERVYKLSGAGWIVRPALDNFDVIFIAQIGTATIWYSNDAGQTATAPRVSYQTSIKDLRAESATVVYVLNADGKVSKAVDGGFLWDNPVNASGAGTASSLTLLAKDNLIAAGATGVGYSTDGGNTWTSTGLAFANAAFVVADKLSSGGVISAVSSDAVNGVQVKQFTIGTSTKFGDSVANLGTTFNATGMVLNSGVVYVIANDNANTTTLRSKITAAAWTSASAPGATLVELNAAGGKLIAANTAAEGSIWTYTDIFAAAGPAVSQPAAGFVDPINIQTGGANNIVFQWTAITGSPVGTKYVLQIALDSAFTQVVKTFDPTTLALVVVGPTADMDFEWQADTTYYWRVRVSDPVDSPWSATPRSLKIDTLRPLAITAPASGSNNVPINPTFVWSAVPGATTYEVIVSDDPTFKIITFSRTTDKPEFASDEALAYGTVYYWRVRASAPATAVTPYVNGIFTTVGKPVPPTTNPPPVTVTNVTPTVTVSLPPPVEAIPSYLLWIIIGIGAILVIALIVLIVRTRRNA